nr:glycoprotein [Aransas Bay virus]
MFVLLVPLFFTLTLAECDPESPSGPYILDSFHPPQVDLIRETIRAKRITPSQEEEVFTVGYRAAWKSYCYNGGPLDSNTGCNTELVPLPPTKQELEDWGDKGKCEHGDSCVDCWGSDSYACLNQLNPHGHWTERRELQRRETNWKFAYHMCNIDWRCGVEQSKAFFNLEWKNSNVVVNTLLPNGSVIQHTVGKSAYWTSGQFGYIASGPLRVKEEQVNIACFFDCSMCRADQTLHNGVVYCQDGPKFFRADVDKFCLQDACYDLQGAIQTVKSKYFQKFQKAKLKRPDSTWNGNNHYNAINSHKASIEDLQMLMQSQMYDQEGQKLVIAQMDARFKKMTEVLNVVIDSLAKIDEKLIGKLLDKPLTTKFLNDKKFILYKCATPITTDSNCYGDSTFKDGRWVRKGLKDNCVNISTVPVNPINVYNFNESWTPTPVEIRFRGVVEDEEGWNFVAQAKADLIETMLNTQRGGAGTSLQDVLSIPKGWLQHQLSSLFLGGVGGYVMYGILFLVVFALLKKANVF